MITGVILAHNEERNVKACIEALRPHVAEVLLIDAESDDRTRQIAEPLVDRVIAHPNLPNFDAIRNAAIGESRHDWMWFVDADERIPEQTGSIVNRLIRERGGEFEAICIPFKTYFCGQWMQHCGWWPGYTCPRVLKRGYFEFSPMLHGGVQLTGREIRLPPDPATGVEHVSYRSVEHYLEKCNRYTSTEALQLAQRGVWWDWREANRAFVRDLWEHYEFHDSQGDGDRGWIHTWLSATYRWLSFAKLLDQGRSQEKRGVSSIPQSLDEVLEAISDDLAEYRATAPTEPLGLILRVDIAQQPLPRTAFVNRFVETGRQTRLDLPEKALPESLNSSDRLLFQALQSGARPRHSICVAYADEKPIRADRGSVMNVLFVNDEQAGELLTWPTSNDEFDEAWVVSEQARTHLIRSGAAAEKTKIVDPFSPGLDNEIERLEAIAMGGQAVASIGGLRVELQGEFFSGHSFSNLNERIAASFANACKFDLSLSRRRGMMIGDGHLRPNADRKQLTYAQLAPYFKQTDAVPDVVIRHAYPPDWTKPQGAWIHIQPWEFGVLPPSWIAPLTNDVDEIWVMSRYVEDVYRRSGVPDEKMHYVPWGVDPAVFHPNVVKRRLPTDKAFRFVYVGGTIKRKGFDRVLDAYLTEFGARDDVALVVKDIGANSVYFDQTMRRQIFQAAEDPGNPEIVYFDHETTPCQLASLYAACDCLVAPYRGEGFGLPILEAMATGLCPIVPDLGPAIDFANAECAILIPSRLVPVDLDEDVPGATEIDIRLEDLRKALRDAYEQRHRTREFGSRAASRVHASFTWSHTVELMEARIQAVADGRREAIVRPAIPPQASLTAVILSRGAGKKLLDTLALMRPFVDCVVVSPNVDAALRNVVDEYGASMAEPSQVDLIGQRSSEWTVVLAEGEYLAERDLKAATQTLHDVCADFYSLGAAGSVETRICRTDNLSRLLAHEPRKDETIPLGIDVQGTRTTLQACRPWLSKRSNDRFGRLDKSVMIQLAAGEHVEYLQITQSFHEQYCRRYGIDYWKCVGSPVVDKRASWGKLPLILAAIDCGYQNVIWIDADAVIVDPRVDLTQRCPNGIGLVRHPSPWHWNMGVILAAANDRTRAMFSSINDAPENDTPWMEQFALNVMSAQPEAAESLCELELRFNSVPGFAEADRPVIVGAHGQPHERRLAVLTEAVADAAGRYERLSCGEQGEASLPSMTALAGTRGR